jgi:hypothetical protein
METTMKRPPVSSIARRSCSFRTVTTGVILCTIVSISSTSEAQSIATGTRVRILSGDSLTAGHVVQSTPDSIVVGRDGGGHLALSWNDVDRTDYSAGTRGNAGRGALVGAGLMSLFAIGSVAFEGTDDDESAFRGDEWGAEILIIVLPLFAAVGAGVGAIVGSMIRTERWHMLPISVSSRDGKYSFGVSLAIRW